MTSVLPQVFFDESGNTGQNLLDSDSPVFSLASCRFAPEQIRECAYIFDGHPAPELKFTTLRKWPVGQEKILRFLQSVAVHRENVAVYAIHKSFMVVTKYCDIVLEPYARSSGVDFYACGRNIATANLLAMTMPGILGEITWNGFLQAFVRVVREKTISAFHDFKTKGELIHSFLEQSQPLAANFFEPILMLAPTGHDLIGLMTGYDLDPLTTSYHHMAALWSNRLGTLFEIVADESKALVAEAPRLMAFSDPALKSITIGYDRRTQQFPLKVAKIHSADSKQEQGVQFADIVCGAACAFLKSEQRFVAGTFEANLMEVFFEKELFIGALWPTKDINPTALGTNQVPSAGQDSLAEYTAKILRGDLTTRSD